MTFRVDLAEPARRDLERLPRDDQARVVFALERLEAQWPLTRLDVRRLQGGSGLWRLRVGRYRILFAVDGHTLVVTRIGDRSSIYR